MITHYISTRCLKISNNVYYPDVYVCDTTTLNCFTYLIHDTV